MVSLRFLVSKLCMYCGDLMFVFSDEPASACVDCKDIIETRKPKKKAANVRNVNKLILFALITLGGVAFASFKYGQSTQIKTMILEREDRKDLINLGHQQAILCGASAMMSPTNCGSDSECESEFVHEVQTCLDRKVLN